MSDSDFVVDFRFVEIEYQLWALGAYLGLLEKELPNLGEQARLEVLERLREQKVKPDDPEVDIAFQELYELVDHVLPRSFRNSLLVAMWAIYESAINEVAVHLQKEMHSSLGLQDIRGKDPLVRARKYFDHVLKFPLCTDDRAWTRLEMLIVLRNAIAHANGQMSAISVDVRKKIEGWARQNIGICADENLALSRGFLQETYSVVNESLRDLVKRARAFS